MMLISSRALAQSTAGVEIRPDQKWAAAWTMAPQGRSPGFAGNPALVNFAFPVPDPPALTQARSFPPNQSVKSARQPDGADVPRKFEKPGTQISGGRVGWPPTS